MGTPCPVNYRRVGKDHSSVVNGTLQKKGKIMQSTHKRIYVSFYRSKEIRIDLIIDVR